MPNGVWEWKYSMDQIQGKKASYAIFDEDAIIPWTRDLKKEALDELFGEKTIW